jgi:ABC-type lipoprotein export system ATPase subunit
VLMDEPAGALDAENNEKLMDLARKLNKELN